MKLAVPALLPAAKVRAPVKMHCREIMRSSRVATDDYWARPDKRSRRTCRRHERITVLGRAGRLMEIKVVSEKGTNTSNFLGR